MLPHFVQNLALAFSLFPQLMQNFTSGSSVSLSRGVNLGGTVTSSLGPDPLLTLPYILVTAPLGRKDSSTSGARSESFLLPFSSIYSKSRGPRSDLSGRSI